GPSVRNDTGPSVRNDSPKEESLKEDEVKEDVYITTPSAEETEFLQTLSLIENYPYNQEKDLRLYRQLKELFPKVDVVGETKKWACYKLDRPLKPNSNPRSQLRNWMEIAARKQTEGVKHNVGTSRKNYRPAPEPSRDFSDWLA
ncbi:MAG: hypothetical protein ACPLQP_01875, partial [Moorellaceae bacterium]